MRKISELLGKSLVCLIEGTDEGVIKNITFDKKLRKPKWLIVSDSDGEYEYAVNINSVFRSGPDAVVIKSRNELFRTEAAEGLELNSPMNSGVFTSGGKRLGSVKDIYLDAKKNEVVSLLLSEGAEIAAERIFSSGGSAVIITEEKETLKITAPKAPRTFRRAPAKTERKQPAPQENITVELTEDEWTPPKPEPQKKLIGDYNFLLGRKTNTDIFNKQNEKIIKKNTLITREIVEKARAAGKLIDLTVHSLPEQYIY